jgi:hypothetical protein
MFEHIGVQATLDLTAALPATGALIVVDSDRNSAGSASNTTIAFLQ